MLYNHSSIQSLAAHRLGTTVLEELDVELQIEFNLFMIASNGRHL
jgi:hypothetical protein